MILSQTHFFLMLPNSPYKNCLGIGILKFQIQFFFMKKDWNLSLWSMGKWQIANILEMANRRVKRSENWDSSTITPCMGYLWAFSVKRYFGVIRCTCLQMAGKSKTAGHRVKCSDIWSSDVIVVCIWGTFDLLVFSVQGHFEVDVIGAKYCLKIACNSFIWSLRKTEWNGLWGSFDMHAQKKQAID